MSSVQRNKSFNAKTVNKPVFLSPQPSKRITIQSPNFLRELEMNERFRNQREKLLYAERRKSMSLGDLPLKEMGFFGKLTSKLTKSKSMNVKNADLSSFVQKYRNRNAKEGKVSCHCLFYNYKEVHTYCKSYYCYHFIKF